MSDRNLRVTKPNKKWCDVFFVQKSRKDLPHRDAGDHAYQSGTKAIKSRANKE